MIDVQDNLMAELKKALFSICLTGLLLLPTGNCIANDTRLTPFIALRQEYNDNIFFDGEDKTADHITTISPGLRFEDATERYASLLSAQAHGIHYAENDVLDNIDQNYIGRLGYSVTPRLDVLADLAYTVDSRRDRDIETSGLVTSNVERKRQLYSLSGEMALNDKTAAEFGYVYGQDNYDDPEFLDVKAHEAILGLQYSMEDIIPRTTGQVNYRFTRYDYADTVVGSHSVAVGPVWELSELYTLMVEIGARYSTRYSQETGSKNYDETAGVGEANLNYNGELTRIRLSLLHGLRPASGRSGVAERSSLTCFMTQNITQGLWGSLTLGYRQNRADQEKLGTQDVDETTWFIRPDVRYELTRDLSFQVLYERANILNNREDTEVIRNLVYFQLLYEYTLME